MRNCIFVEGNMGLHSNRQNSILNITLKDGSVTTSGTGSTDKPIAKNVVVGPTGTWDATSVFDAASTNNSGPSGTTPPGANPLTDVVDGDFVDRTNDDLHMVAGATFEGQGVNLSGDFTDDIDLETRPAAGAWSRGADELPAAAANRAVFQSYGQEIGQKRGNN